MTWLGGDNFFFIWPSLQNCLCFGLLRNRVTTVEEAMTEKLVVGRWNQPHISSSLLRPFGFFLQTQQIDWNIFRGLCLLISYHLSILFGIFLQTLIIVIFKINCFTNGYCLCKYVRTIEMGHYFLENYPSQSLLWADPCWSLWWGAGGRVCCVFVVICWTWTNVD